MLIAATKLRMPRLKATPAKLAVEVTPEMIPEVSETIVRATYVSEMSLGKQA
jgi:hypothetical protein